MCISSSFSVISSRDYYLSDTLDIIENQLAVGIWVYLWTLFKKKDFMYLFLEGKGERKRRRETSMSGCLSCTPSWGPGLQLRHVPWLGIEPVTLWFTGLYSIHWVTPARATYGLLIVCWFCILILHPETLLSSFISSNSFCVWWGEGSFGLSIYKIMSTANRDNFTSFFLMWMPFVSFPCPIALTWTSVQSWVEEAKGGHLSLVPNLLGKALQSFTV